MTPCETERLIQYYKDSLLNINLWGMIQSMQTAGNLTTVQPQLD